jgi:uncharacterized membrane protein
VDEVRRPSSPRSVRCAVLVYGLVVFDALAVVTGVVIMQVAKLWYIDRMVLLFQAMKARDPQVAAWEYSRVDP